MKNVQKLGLFLFIASFLPWLAILFIVPFLPLSLAEKTTIDIVLAVGAEICFWISVVLLGKEVVTKYRRYLNPRYLWKKIRNFNRR
ncbi:transporter suffix domain-containing protein [Tychonema sp. LEGE 07203]|uniref:transporter suffix domain-containing protein n=1 Tax=Tychonema sp. LEGE 07203 TaxID=1828671 RepID=UPI001D158BA4|nr:transporter suffix domain-containing protein [Tychonema sp. LEGE 07203]